MIDVKQAIAKALEYLKNIYEITPDLMLEEVELSQDQKYWFITFGFAVERTPAPNELLQGLFRKSVRTYKIVQLDAHSGEFVAMKIREAQAA